VTLLSTQEKRTLLIRLAIYFALIRQETFVASTPWGLKMSERLNFICLLDRELSAVERRASIESVVTCVARCADGQRQGQLVSLMHLDDGGNQTERPWQYDDHLIDVALGPDDLLVAYFRIQGDERLESVSIESRLARTVLTLSISPDFLGEIGGGAPAVLTALAQWLLSTCNLAALACGPELDLYEIEDQTDIRAIEKALAGDWRCRYTMIAGRTGQPSGSSV
jgi:hypothetical protein